MQNEVLVMYQEVKSLTKDALPYVLKKELEIVDLFKQMMEGCVENKELFLTERQIKMAAHNIYVLGQMWAFRRWELRKIFTLEEYIELQTELIIGGIKGGHREGNVHGDKEIVRSKKQIRFATASSLNKGKASANLRFIKKIHE